MFLKDVGLYEEGQFLEHLECARLGSMLGFSMYGYCKLFQPVVTIDGALACFLALLLAEEVTQDQTGDLTTFAHIAAQD